MKRWLPVEKKTIECIKWIEICTSTTHRSTGIVDTIRLFRCKSQLFVWLVFLSLLFEMSNTSSHSYYLSDRFFQRKWNIIGIQYHLGVSIQMWLHLLNSVGCFVYSSLYSMELLALFYVKESTVWWLHLKLCRFRYLWPWYFHIISYKT